MRFLTYRNGIDYDLGIVSERGVLPLSHISELDKMQIPNTINALITSWNEISSALMDFVDKAVREGQDSLFFDETILYLGPCVPNPGKIICVGLNYRRHAEETNAPVPEVPILFNKFNNTIAAPGQIIPLPFNSKEVDYEAELVIVIGKACKRVSKDRALEYVFGYCNTNDLSARDLQFRTQQWLLGKSCDGFSPVGPYLVTADEVGDPNALSIRTYVNGEVRQNSNTSDMVFHCDEIISYISQHMTLSPGDIIMTGTPEGVVLGLPKEKQVWLKDGDEVTIEIEGLGRLTNVMHQEV